MHRLDLYKELHMIKDNGTQQRVVKCRNRKVIGVKWIFNTKKNPSGTVCKHKASFVVQTYTQQYGEDYKETFSLEAKYDTIQLILAFASHSSQPLHYVDVKTNFLDGLLAEEIYVEKLLVSQFIENKIKFIS